MAYLDNKSKPYKRYLLTPGKVVTFDGVEITSLESGNVDALKIRRFAASKNLAVGEATGILRPNEPEKITSLATLEGKQESVAYWPWKWSYDKVKNQSNFSNQISKMFLDPKIGPNTRIEEPSRINIGFGLASGLWERFAQPTHFVPIFFTYEDTSWAQTLLNNLFVSTTGNEPKSICPSRDSCSGIQVKGNLKDTAIMLIALPSNQDRIPESIVRLSTSKAFTIAVEQAAYRESIIESKASCCINEIIPPWYLQGLAEFTAAVVSTLEPQDNYLTVKKDAQANYLKIKKMHIENLKSSDISKEDIDTILSAKSPNEWKSQRKSIYEAVGFLSIEAIIAAKGLTPLMQALVDHGKDTSSDAFNNFLRQFERNFGISSELGIKEISKSIISTMNS